MLKPLLDNVLVKEEGSNTVTESGIEIVEAKGHKKNHLFGEVISVGPGKDKDTPLGVNKGDRIMYRAGGWPITLEGVEYQVINSTLILGVMEKEPASIVDAVQENHDNVSGKVQKKMLEKYGNPGDDGINPDNKLQSFYHYDLQEKDKQGVSDHPQDDMKRLSNELGFKILDAIPQSMGDRWDIWIESESEKQPEVPDYFFAANWKPVGEV